MFESVASETFSTVEAGIRRSNPSDAVADRRRVRLQERQDAFEDRLLERNQNQLDGRQIQFAPDTFNALLLADTTEQPATTDAQNQSTAASVTQTYENQNRPTTETPSGREAEYLLAVA